MSDSPKSSSGSPNISLGRQAALFLLLVAGIISVVYAGIVGMQVYPLLWAMILFAAAGLFYLSPRIAEFMEYERGVFFRFGKFNYVASAGIHLWFPVFDSYQRVDMRVFRVQVPVQPVITSDNITVKIGVVFMVKVTDAKKAVLEVRDYKHEITDLSSAELRNAVSKYTLQEVLDETDKIHDQMVVAIERIASSWGLQLARLAVETIEIPPEIKAAMDARRQAIERKAAIETNAQARKSVITVLNEAAGNLSPTTMEFLYLETLRRMADGKSTKIVLPMELSKIAEFAAKKLGNSTFLSKE